jgi:hypothetical protein
MLSWRRTIPDRLSSIDPELKTTEPIVSADVHPYAHCGSYFGKA